MVVRCPPDLKLALEVDAAREHRSRERHILHILEEYMRKKEARRRPGRKG